MARKEILPKDVARYLRDLFDKLPYDVTILVFSDKRHAEMDEAVKTFVSMFKDLSSKVHMFHKDLGDPEAATFQVDRTPVLLFCPDRYHVRYLGLPLGEEGRTLVETIIHMGTRSDGLSDQSKKVLSKLAEKRHIKVFVSATCPYCPQQAINAVKAAVALPEKVSVEIVDIEFNPDLARAYEAFSVPQVIANETLTAQGAQPEELFMASLVKLVPQTIFIPDIDAEEVQTDLVIVGGGPAGLTAGIYAVRSGLRAVVVERGNLGGQVASTPMVENYPGLSRVPGKTLVDIMVSHALEYVKIFPNEEVVEVHPNEEIEVLTTRRRFRARAVLLATGASYRRLGVPGEERLAGRGVSYCSTCDGPLYRGKKALVIGGGNSAVTEALHLNHIGVKVTLVHRRDALRAQEHLVKSLETSEIPVLWNTEVQEIVGDRLVKSVILKNNKTGETFSRETDAVFVAIGYVAETTLAQKLGLPLTPDGFVQHDGSHRTIIAGIYTAGDVEGGYRQIVTATAAGAAAALTIFEDLSNPYWTRHKQTG
ncbi:MAG: FAD-dependent oxidoreductase [Desulfosoma sp.]